MITILATVMLSQLTLPPAVGLFGVQQMVVRQTGKLDSWNATNGRSLTGEGGFRNVAPQSQSQLKARAKAEEKKNPDGKIECGENCLCTKISEKEVKEILSFIAQQKERQAQFERFRQQNPNGGFRGRPQQGGDN